MWLRRAFFFWLLPAAVVLPAWLFLGWILSGAGGFALLWVLLIAIPSVVIGELILALLVRARGTVRHTRMVSWQDVAGFGVWHLLTIGVGLFNAAFWPLLTAAVIVFFVLVWSTLRQLFEETRPSAVFARYTRVDGFGAGSAVPGPGRADAGMPDVVVLEEKRGPAAH